MKKIKKFKCASGAIKNSKIILRMCFDTGVNGTTITRINSLQILHRLVLSATASCNHHKTKIAWMQLHLSVDAALQLHEERNSIDLINVGWSLKLANSTFVLCTSRLSVVAKISDEKFMALFFCVLLALCRLAAGKVAAKGVK